LSEKCRDPVVARRSPVVGREYKIMIKPVSGNKDSRWETIRLDKLDFVNQTDVYQKIFIRY